MKEDEGEENAMKVLQEGAVTFPVKLVPYDGTQHEVAKELEMKKLNPFSNENTLTLRLTWVVMNVTRIKTTAQGWKLPSVSLTT